MAQGDEQVFDSTIFWRESPIRWRSSVRIGCGAGFAGDRPAAALKLLKRVTNLHYLVLECLAERTFTERVEAKASGGKGYDPRIREWMTVLLPVSVIQGVCIITNMGGVDPLGAEEEVLKVCSELGINVSVAVAYEYPVSKNGSSTYLGAAPIVQVLQKGKPDVIITSRLADVSLFLGPMVYELGWNWSDYAQLAQGAVCGHLLECGCQLTGGYYMHPAKQPEDGSRRTLLDISLPYAEVFWDGKVVLAKAEHSGGELSRGTCAQQLLYEIEDPASYITPDVILDLRNVSFEQLSPDKVLVTGAQANKDGAPQSLLRLVPSFCGWKGWGEISYGGFFCEERASISDQLVRSWLEESYPGLGQRIVSYMIGKDSLFGSSRDPVPCQEVRLRLDGLFDKQEQAVQLVREFGALYTNGPAGGGGISSGWKKETTLNRELVSREKVRWKVHFGGNLPDSRLEVETEATTAERKFNFTRALTPAPAPAGDMFLHHVAHSRTGDKGNTLNFSVIPYCPQDLNRLQQVITVDWVTKVFARALGREDVSVSIYRVEGVTSLNVVVKNALDGGVTCSRRIDRHGKTISDLILMQRITLPPLNEDHATI